MSLTEKFLREDLARATARIATLEQRLDSANHTIGGQAWTIGDLRRQLAEANEAVGELQAMNERAQAAE